MNFPTHDEPTRWLWRTNPRMEQVRQFYLFCMFTSHWLRTIQYLIPYHMLEKTYTHAKTLILHLISNKLLGVQKHDQPTPLFPIIRIPRSDSRDIIAYVPVAFYHYSDIIMGAMKFQITSLAVVYSTVYSGADQGKLQISASLAFVWGIHQWPVNSQHKGPVTRKFFFHLMTSPWHLT